MEEELEKEIQRYNEEQDGDCRYVQTARHFARWMREQMMKEAVEGDIGMILHDKTSDLFVRSKGYLPKSLGIKCDDKVELIIVKKD